MSDTEHMAYAGYCKECGRMVAAVVDDPNRPRDVAKSVAEFMRGGVRIERLTCQAVREAAWMCTDDCACRHCVKRRRARTRKAQLENANAAQGALL